MNNCFVFVVIVFGIYVLGDACKYSKFTDKHLACLPPNKTCQIVRSGLNSAQKELLISTHNRYRNMVASGKQGQLPSASDMIELRWDTELAMLAQKHVNQCIFSFDCTTCRQLDRFAYVGENLYKKTSIKLTKAPNFNFSMSLWFKEVSKFNPDYVKSYRVGPAVGYFSQMVWSRTRAVGCGYSAYKENATMFVELLICNYGPTGNVLNNSVYTIGPPCSKCPNNHECSLRYSSLCSYKKDTPQGRSWPNDEDISENVLSFM